MNLLKAISNKALLPLTAYLREALNGTHNVDYGLISIDIHRTIDSNNQEHFTLRDLADRIVEHN